MRVRHLAVVGALVLAAACSENPTLPSSGTGRFRIVNGARSAGAVQVFLDGIYLGAVPVGTVAGLDNVTGVHDLQVDRGNGAAGFLYLLDIDDDETVTLVAWDSSGYLRPSALADTNAIVPAGATKLRVAHFATSAPNIDIWRTQPDFGTAIRVQFPFPYLAVSPYLQSTVGNWQVFVTDTIPSSTPTAPMPTTSLANTAAISIPDGQSRTVVVVDAATTGIQLVVLDP